MKKLGVLFVLTGLFAVGWLLYELHGSVLRLQQQDFTFSKPIKLADELKNDSRILAAMALNAVQKSNADSAKEYEHILDVRHGRVARSSAMQVAPGRVVPFTRLTAGSPFTRVEMDVLNRAYAASEDLTALEQRAMRLALSTKNRTEALRLLTEESYIQKRTEIDTALEGLSQRISTRLAEESDALGMRISLLIVALCIALSVIFGGSVLFLHWVGFQNIVYEHQRNKSLYLYAVILLYLSLLIPIFFIYKDAQWIMLKDLEERQNLLCDNVYAELMQRINFVKELTGILASSPTIKRYALLTGTDTTEAEISSEGLRILQSFSAGYTDIVRIEVVNRKGILVGEENNIEQEKRLPEDIFARIVEGETLVTLLPAPQSGKKEPVVVMPIHSAQKQKSVIGAVLSYLDTQKSFRIWEGRLSLEEQMDIFVVNSQGDVVLTSRRDVLDTVAAEHVQASQIVINNMEGLQYYTDDQGHERVGVFRKFPELHWTVVASSNFARLSSPIKNVLTRATVLGTVTALCALFLFTLIMRRMTGNLRVASERMANLIHDSGMFRWEIDMQARTYSFDEQWPRILGYPDPREGSWTFEELVAAYHPDEYYSALDAVNGVPEGGFISFVRRVRTYTGEWLWIKIFARVDKVDAEGKALLLSGAGADVTAHKQLEESEAALRALSQELSASNERMAQLMEGGGIHTWEYSATAGQFTLDAQWLRNLHWPEPLRPECWPMPRLLEALHPDSLPVVQGLMTQESNSVGEYFVFDLRIRNYHGEYVWHRSIARTVEVDCLGRRALVSGMGYDITAQKTLEESEMQLEALVLQRTTELEESRNQALAASEAKSTFLSTISHEIRTPMNAIVGFAHLFKRSKLTPHQEEYLEKIELSASTLLGIINDVLDISKIESGKLELENLPFPVHQLMDTVCSMVGIAANEKGLDLQAHVAANVPDVLVGDRKRITQILLNLLNNAVKFTPQGRVELQVNLQEAHSPQEPQEQGQEPVVLQVSVTDTGIGLTPEQRQRLFVPFMQADNSITRRFGGTGLGLAITKQLVELMGGEISLTSELGRGSTFFFTLRLVACSEEHAAQGTGPAEDFASKAEQDMALHDLYGKRVLVVEDNEINQEIAKAMLEELGLEVDMADNGQVALDMAGQHSYACILMDMQMPVMDGLEATRHLRRMGMEAEVSGTAPDPHLYLAHIPIIAMTANVMVEDRQRCLHAGMQDHISKPIDPLILRNTLLFWLGLHPGHKV